jgi:hypothetical protein
VTVASQAFFKLMLLKSYMRTTKTQEMLNDLATILYESEVLAKIDYEISLKILFRRSLKNDVVQINMCNQELNRYGS